MSDATVNRPVPERRRWPILFAVLSLLALGGIGNAFVRHGQQLSLASPNDDLSAASVTSSATSSAWYCPGALPIGARNETSSIAIANVARHAVTGELVVAASTGKLSRRSLSIGSGAQVVVGLARTGTPRFAAVSVLAGGSGIGVEELIHGPFGAISAPCVSHSATTQYLPQGGTSGANNLSLSIYDPGATPAVANVSFATAGGVASPPAFQGVPVGAGQMVVLNVGHFLPSRPVVATTVSSSGGRVVAGALVTSTVGQSLSYALVTAVPTPVSSWFLPAAPAGTSVRQTFSILDPGPATAQVAVHLAPGLAQFNVTVGSGQVKTFAAGSDATSNALRWAAVTTSAHTPVIVARTTEIFTATERRVAAPSTTVGKPTPLQRAITSSAVLPALPPGIAVTGPVLAPSPTWMLPGGEIDARTDEVVTIANPGSSAARVSLHGLKVPASKGAQPFPDRSGFLVPAKGSLVIDTGTLDRTQPALGLVVSASVPVVVGQMLAARGASGSFGLTAVAGIPVG